MRKLSTSQCQGLIRLLPKKDRNLLVVSNWCPITLLNVDYKILTKLFAKRLKDILPKIVAPDQRGFIAGRHLSESILDVYALIDLILERDDDYFLCSIDVQKAFDSVNWEFLRRVLNLFGFPQEFLQWFNIFYTDRTAHVVNNNEWSNVIHIQKGNFQGCSLSPLFFALVIEILANRIRNNKDIQGVQLAEINKKLNLVADDILLVFKNTIIGCVQVSEELKRFSLNSGLKINMDKCSITRINKQGLPPDVGAFPSFQRAQENFTYIGYHISLKQDELWEKNIPPIINKMIHELETCSQLGPASVLGRVLVFKSLFFSRLPYFLEMIPLSQTARDLGLIQAKFNS